eukprot:TRINITY_DN18534_c0_g1_i1.p1 TRINITY_DN18534_c0_g1~~TRINITY_DN18534_c0_g1_i1.p1  ORF type:complete len:532 (-),score=86.73 TRINITY_DN18534_c0_g1_i1:502-2097(-)
MAVRLFFASVLLLWRFIHADVQTHQWYGRSIYFVVTDRFAQNDAEANSEAPSCAGRGWCGGTLKGVERRLDYIQGMGFDAVWITPVVKQAEWLDAYNGTAYHGYWATDFFAIEPHFGTEEDLKSLRRACDRRGMLLMLDIVANHVGPIHDENHILRLGDGLNYPSGKQFHQLGRRNGESLADYIRQPVSATTDAGSTCWPDFRFDKDCSYTVMLDGWFGDLADLNQEDPAVRDYLLRWVRHMSATYGAHGYRLDTTLYMPQWFLGELQQAAGVYMTGEVTTDNVTFHRSFANALTGLLNFPLTDKVRSAFNVSGSLAQLKETAEEQQAAGYPDLHLLCNFVDNHDSPRFLYDVQGDIKLLKNSLTFTMLYHGIPIVYYGTEQEAVSNHADDRISMWPHFGETALSHFLSELNQLRRRFGFAAGGEQVRSLATIVAAAVGYMVFVRGDLLVLLTNQALPEMEIRLAVGELPGRWQDVCHRSHSLQTVLGNSSLGSCVDGGQVLRVSTTAGLPAAFALLSSATPIWSEDAVVI